MAKRTRAPSAQAKASTHKNRAKPHSPKKRARPLRRTSSKPETKGKTLRAAPVLHAGIPRRGAAADRAHDGEHDVDRRQVRHAPQRAVQTHQAREMGAARKPRCTGAACRRQCGWRRRPMRSPMHRRRTPPRSTASSRRCKDSPPSKPCARVSTRSRCGRSTPSAPRARCPFTPKRLPSCAATASAFKPPSVRLGPSRPKLGQCTTGDIVITHTMRTARVRSARTHCFSRYRYDPPFVRRGLGARTPVAKDDRASAKSSRKNHTTTDGCTVALDSGSHRRRAPE